MQPRWILARDAASDQLPWAELCDSACIASLLRRRNFTDADAVRAYLQPRLSGLSDPFLLRGMEEAVARVLQAIDQKQRVVLFGDYDVDGVTSLALLARVLHAYGNDVAVFLPHRMEEGYGLSADALARCLSQHDPQLLIAVDCGTSSIAEIRQLRERKIDVIVLDHHEPKSEQPNCILVNPKAEDASAFEYLCSVGIVFKLCHALLRSRRLEFDLKNELDLVALGTVADIVPLRGDNRAFVKSGSAVIGTTRRVGLRKLIEIAGVKTPIAPDDIGFRLGPRLNAAGRLDTAEKALRLLLTDDAVEAEALARELDAQNRERQDVEKRILAAAEELLAREPGGNAAIALAARDWHPGVLGIVASRLSKKYHRPTMIIGFDGNGMGKGSGRSIEGFSLVDALQLCDGALERFGGHEMAAGVTLREENFLLFRDRFLATARARLTDDALMPRLHLDAEIALADIDFDLLHWHEMLQPFGNGNPQPVFVACGVEPALAPRVVGERHLSLQLKQRNWTQRAIFFDGTAAPLPPAPWDVAFRIRPDVYQGETRISLHVQGIRSVAPLA